MRLPNRLVFVPILTALISLAGTRTAHAQTTADLAPELARILAADGATSDLFGSAVALSGDTLAVGAPSDTVGANSLQGSVRVYVRVGGSWTLQQTIVASDGVSGDKFGTVVSLSGDTLAVGVPLDDVGTATDQGSVRVFVRSGSSWSAQGTLAASDGVSGDRFGAAVSLAGDVLAVGVPSDMVGSNTAQGSVRMYTRSGTAWSAQTTLAASDGAAFDSFGTSVALSGDTLAVGAPYDDIGSNFDQGSVRVFTRVFSSWNPQATLAASDGAATDSFGTSVALSGDTLAVGVQFDDIGPISDQGSVRVFTRSGSSWFPEATLTAPEFSTNVRFGAAVSVSDNTVVAGAIYDGPVSAQGSVRVFSRGAGGWLRQATLRAPSGMSFDQFGTAVALSGDLVAVGIPLEDVGASADQGGVRIFGQYKARNATRGTFHQSLTDAISGAFAGDRLLVGAPAFAQADGIVDASQKRLTFTALEPVAIPSAALVSVANDTVFEKSTAVAAGGVTVNGRLVAPIAGTVTFQELAVGSLGQLTQRGSNILVNQNLSTAAGGVAYLEGTVLAQTVSTAAGGQNRVAGNTNIFGNYANAGATVIQRGILYIYGTLTNSGTITGNFNNGFLPPEPGDGYSIGDDYIVFGDGSIILPDPVWWLRVGGNFDVKIDSASRFVMDQATLELTGLDPKGEQSVEVMGRDLGEDEAGFEPANFPIGSVRLRAGTRVKLVNEHRNAGGKGAEAIYTQELVVPAGAMLDTNGLRIYTRVATIAGEVSNPEDIVVVPGTPPCVADIFPNGVVDAADLSALLVSWGPCAGGACVADLDRDGQVNASDLAQLLVSWGPCAN